MATYTESMLATMQDSQPLNLEKAKKLADDFGLPYRSVISKAKQLGLEYIKVSKAKKADGDNTTKADIVQEIRSTLSLPERDGDLTKADLEAILIFIKG